MAEIKIVKGNQSFSVSPTDMDLMDFLKEIQPVLKELSLYRLVKDPKTKKFETELEKTFYILDFRRNSIILINTYYKKFINAYSRKFNILVEEVDEYKTVKLHCKINKKYKPREYQKEYIKAIVDNQPPRILVDLYTGYGKSLIATLSSIKRGRRFALLVLPRYIKKWIGDLKEYTDLTDENIFVVKGSDSIRYLSTASKQELAKIEVLIFSLTTMREYLSNYLDITNIFKYPLEPNEFIRKLGIETIVSDETHQEFHNIYALTKVLDPKFMLALTATLITKNKREQIIQNYFFPEHYRLSGIVEYTKYIELYPISYSVRNPNSLKAENMYGYSHIKFEDKIKKRKHSLENYLQMIYFTIGMSYIKYRTDGDKCIVFASSIEMCELIRDYVAKRQPELKVAKYTAEDDYEVIEESDIIISTLGSAGTALDIKNLITVVQTVLVKSITSNVQALGRLRRLENKKVRFVYLYANNIKKHNEYHRERLSIYRDRVKVIYNLNYSKVI